MPVRRSSRLEPRRPTETARLGLTKLPSGLPLAEVFARACELASKAIDVERVGIWLFVEDRSALRCAALYEKSKNEHSIGSVLRMADFPTYFSALTIRKAVPAELAASDPRTAELAEAYLNPLGITSLLDAGIFLESELAGVVCHEHVGPPREWTTEDRDFAGSVADLVALRIQAAEVNQLRSAFRTQEERLVSLEKAAALEHLAAGVAHDFRNLLTVVVGNGELLAGKTGLTPEARDQVKDLLDAARRGVDLVKELLDFARPAERPAVLDLADVVSKFLPVLRRAVGNQQPIQYLRPQLLGKVLIDESQFTRLLLNLVLNARDASESGKAIEIRLAPVRLTGGFGISGNYVLLEVTDQGVGMDDGTRRRAFDPYFTTKPKGTGLGLAVVRRVADRSGGLVRIESEPGQGTTVRVFFPRVGASSGGTTEFPALLPEEITR